MKRHTFWRKPLSVLLAIGITMTSYGTMFVSAATGITLGDVVSLGSVTAYDATTILHYALGDSAFTAQQKLQADVNGDGNITSSDALQVLRYAVGSISSFSISETSATIIGSNVNLRSGAGTSYTSLGKMQKGDAVTVYGTSFDGWYHITYSGTEGYVSADYVQLGSDTTSSTTTSSSSTTSTTTYTGTTTASLNLRSGPSTSYSVLLIIPSGSTVTIYGDASDGWYTVSYNGTMGYASASYITVSSTTSSSTSTDAISISLDVPLYKQSDPRWASVALGNTTIKSVGCLVTSLAMCESYRTGTSITPDQLAATYTFTDGGGLKNWGETGYTVSRNFNASSSVYLAEILSILKQGKPVVVGSYKTTSKTGQHWIVVTGYSGDGVNLSASDFTINDPGYSYTTLDEYKAVFPVHWTCAYYP